MQNLEFDSVLAQIDRLSREDQRELYRRLAEKLSINGGQASGPQMTEDEFEQMLFEKGILCQVPPPITDFAPYENREPVKIDGPPLSETIISDRR
jgi:hypothetical protein